jgi:phospholipid N-methyltransferase
MFPRRQYETTKYFANEIIAMSNSIARYLHFFWAGLVKHGQTGGIVPSQMFLIERMIAPVTKRYRGQVIELGAGNGALTLRLAARCPEARIAACEINPTLARDLRSNVAAAELTNRVEVFLGAATNLLSKMARKSDFVISGIPLGNLGGVKALALVDTIHKALGENGMYTQFQHSLLDRKNIRTRFPNLRTVPVFLNFPPAVVYYAQK